jgi:hypothetical protein
MIDRKDLEINPGNEEEQAMLGMALMAVSHRALIELLVEKKLITIEELEARAQKIMSEEGGTAGHSALVT